jgi:hypothetical protein
MSMATPEAENLTMKQRIFIGVLGVLSVLLAALVVFYFSPTEETGEAFPGRNLSPAVYEAGFEAVILLRPIFSTTANLLIIPS